MVNPPDLREIFDPPNEIVQAALNGDLVLFVGAGASMQLGLPSWSELALKVLGQLRNAELLNFSQINQLKDLDARKQLSIAYDIAEENNIQIDLRDQLTVENNGDSIYKAINDIGCPCVTTNYDEYLAPRFFDNLDGSKTAPRIARISSKEKFYAYLLNEPGTVVHLHGSISKPETMVVTTKDYLAHYDNENVQEFLSELFKKKTILFIGYRLEETEILEHILRRGSVDSSKERKRFSLQGFFQSQEPLYYNLYNYYRKSFGVHLLGFIRDHEDYFCLHKIVKSWANLISVRKPPLVNDVDYIDEVLGND